MNAPCQHGNPIGACDDCDAEFKALVERQQRDALDHKKQEPSKALGETHTTHGWAGQNR